MARRMPAIMNVGTLHKVKRYPKDGYAYGKRRVVYWN